MAAVGGAMALANSDVPVPLLNPATATPTASPTLPPSLTPLPTATETPPPTITPLPPVPYQVSAGDTCAGLAGFFNVSIQSIVELNKLSQSCNLLVGQQLLIPQPTPTPTPLPTATLSGPELTSTACGSVTYTVKDGDTLGGIAANYAVDIDALMAENGINNAETIFSGLLLRIPLCARLATPGPSPTPTPPPPYPAPSLLLPQDGAAFSAADSTVNLQWSSVAVLRQNEFYQVSVEDVTAGTARRLVEFTRATNFIVPVDFRPSEGSPHVFRWSVVAVRQVGTSALGKPIIEPAGATSAERTFAWSGTAATPAG